MNSSTLSLPRAMRTCGELATHGLASVLEFALPARCPGCGRSAAAARLLCESCRSSIPRLSFAVCVRCLRRGHDPVACGAHEAFKVWPAWIYDERCAALIHAFKFAERTALAESLAEELDRARPPGRFDLVMAVPLHAARRRERGYNQAALLADALSARIGVPRLDKAIRRIRPTPPQTLRGAGERRRNLAGAFRATRPSWLAGRRVLLVDDVVTTGATLEAGLELLHGCGANPTALALAWAQ